MKQESSYPNAYYRVSVKAVIKDGDDRILLVREHNDYRVLPGGGIDHGETIEQALQREIAEEVGDDIRVCGAKNIGVNLSTHVPTRRGLCGLFLRCSWKILIRLRYQIVLNL